MGLLSQLVKVVSRTATVPVAAAVDVVRGITADETIFDEGSKLVATLEALREDIERLPDSVDED